MTPFKALVIYYIIINIILFILMGIDKLRAKKNKWRVPESSLFIISIMGGSIGGFCGMYLFHHKTKKWSFKIIYALSLVIHIIIIYLLIKNFVI